ncbi:bifunctional glutamate N-acetyltransferase/amino-acid acetyltransferase ArgJ [Ilumatobacter coccineus]|uniref:Arginine biosynthesis bifunctional protein ArgJ n=1 Tax=Ilumatobacter coccineus (strain NBRC 103263 / KCTC 29153 / YM16-304) TaxID=1313172 RepID=A0A6C7E993_ILUCY|nr:bifunctional glutamate N-acetyltransferase/amino-acid acetyltransferase ArgJ [Ilumatobacter coccineus]BAN03287.1 glutamate N-acetyltransferase/amino-acid acetyltransferase [Ilumatobacter coccineus YM16-304]
MISLPSGFHSHVANIGIKDDTDDFVVVAADRPVPTAAVFTKSRFAGASVTLSRAHVADGTSRAVVVISKNSNVATGQQGIDDAAEVAASVAERLDDDAASVLVTSTGVIGRRYPMERVRAGIAAVPNPLTQTDATRAARGMMTTDTVVKLSEATVDGSAARVVGMAKGVGMIEPDMATHISLLFTDADVSSSVLDAVFRRVVDRTFNCVSIDTDTSTSDSSIVMASGAAGAVDLDAFESALYDVCLDLTKQIARDGEGANSLIEVRVDEALDTAQAKRVAKAIVNSPLVKTAVHGGDPNWGRVAMAIGKCSDDTDIDQERVVIRFGTTEVYPRLLDDRALADLSSYMKSDHVVIHVTLSTGGADATVYGCDLSDTYVRFNADYTT